ncbi:MAG: PorV/PorQ family protein [Bacteroidales bacterium]|nr:PorV/PorQ family protein [Bacteroidales bacterium]
MDETDEYGVNMGTFNVQEAAIYLTYSRKMAPGLTMAATLKPIISKFAEYNSFGLAMDMGLTYRVMEDRLRAAIVLRNLGGQIKRYDGDEANEHLDTDMKIGVVYKPLHAPFRFTMTLKDLFHWDLSIDRKKKIDFGDNLLRHLIMGVEFVPTRNVFVAFGYNHRQHKENRDSAVGGAAGISWGLGVRVAKIDISYGMGKYHTAGAANSITLSTNINRFLKH